MEVIKPPAKLPAWDRYSLFLAGSIDMGEAPDWQAEIEKDLRDLNGYILNPRRDDWDSSWEQKASDLNFHGQVTWELQGLELCSRVLMYLAPGSKSPVSMLELGKYGEKSLVVCPNGFWRKGNVDIFCDRNNITNCRDLDQALEIIRWEARRSQA